MSDTVIQVEGLSKIYRIGLKEEIHDSLVGAVTDLVKRPIMNLKRLRKLSNFSETGDGSEDIVWAVKDVSFEVKKGEVVGIIGRNGAGKSTLLKILCRITEPTEGRAIVEGRVGSLLEVGTGFHPELTGRENVYLNGVILGMKKAEVEKKFDEIVAFSEVEKFIDTPVKRYSSGMKVRLAFAVAAHLEPEILLVDEVLAVGDAAFQKKCLGKMGDVSKEGRTVLFVSHNMAAIQQLCNRVILLQAGGIESDGQPTGVVDSYLRLMHGNSDEDISISELPRKAGFGEKVRFLGCSLFNGEGNIASQYKVRDLIEICIELEARERDYGDLYINIGINTVQQIRILTVTNRSNYGHFSCQKNQTISIKASFDELMLAPGRYNLTLVAGHRGQPLDVLEYVVPFDVVETVSDQVVYYPQLLGIIQARASWEIET
jgi:lipopolysaccharide transport system ATP-binding protein